MLHRNSSAGTAAQKSSKSSLIQRPAIILAMLLLCAVSCTHKRKGEIIKTQDGKFYRLEDAPANEGYFLREVDTAAINRLSK